MTVFLDDIHVSLGDVRRDVRAADAAGAIVSTVEQLTAAGFEAQHICSDTMTAYDLARRAVAPIAARHPRVGAIVYATTLPLNATIGDDADFRRTADVKYLMRYPAARLQADFGFTDAFVLGVGQQACTGLLGALRAARALLLAESYLDPILCLTADRFPAGATYEQAYNLVSDGAVACVVSQRPGPFELIGFHHITNGGLELASDDQTVATYFSYTYETISRVCADAGVATAELAWLVPQNTHAAAAQILARLLGLSETSVFCPTVSSIGHLIAGDALANLAVLRASGRLRTGDLLAVPIAGYGLNWQCALLRATDLAVGGIAA